MNQRNNNPIVFLLLVLSLIFLIAGLGCVPGPMAITRDRDHTGYREPVSKPAPPSRPPRGTIPKENPIAAPVPK